MKKQLIKLKKNILKNIKPRDLLKVLIIGIIILIFYFLVKEFISNVDSITKLSQSAGILGPIVLILLIGLGILLTPIPSFVLVIAAGYLYGIWWGALYSYLGHLIAAISTFTIFRRINLNNQESLRYKKYKKLVEKNKKFLYLLYAVPILPLSLVTIISASSKIKWKHFLEIILVSFIPTILFFSFFGNRITEKNIFEILIWLGIIFVIGLIIFKIIQRNQERMMNGYPSALKVPKLKRKGKYVKWG